MQVERLVIASQLKRHRIVGLTLLAAVTTLAAATLTVISVSAAPWSKQTSASLAIAAQPAARMEAFDATGLPAGPVKGVPQRATLPPGFNLKHAHGGPTYVYVLDGSLDVIDIDGTLSTYQAGDFFWEPIGHTHTAQSAAGAELFILRFLAPRAEATIPVQ